MQLAYISGPYNSDKGPNGIFNNIMYARTRAIEYWKIGFAVLCPHLNTMLMDGSCPRDTWINGDLAILDRFWALDVIILLKGWGSSPGAILEREKALERGLYAVDDDIVIKSGYNMKEYKGKIVDFLSDFALQGK